MSVFTSNLWLALLFSISCSEGKDFKDAIVMQYFSDSWMNRELVENDPVGKSNELVGSVKEQSESCLRFAYQVFIFYRHKENDCELDSEVWIQYEKIISRLLTSFEDDEIRHAFRRCLNLETRHLINFGWSVTGYTLEDFDRDFKEFLLLKKEGKAEDGKAEGVSP